MGFHRLVALRHSICALAALAAPLATAAADVSLVGLYAGKALLMIDGGKPRPVAVGSRTPEGVKVIGIEDGAVQLDIDGRRQRLVVGQHAVSAGSDDREAATVNLTADPGGQYFTVGTINGVPVRFLVDTGATVVAMGAKDAARANVDYLKGQSAMAMTANGTTRVWRVTLNSVRVGDIMLNQVEAAVHEHDLPIVLLGMSFLNRTDMRRDGQVMTLKKRF